MDSNDTIEFGQPGSPAGGPGEPTSAPDDPTSAPTRRWSGRTKRVVTTVAASAVLLGSGAGIGMALTGGASASTGNGSTGNGSAGTSLTGASGAGSAAVTSAYTKSAGRCARFVQRLRSNDHETAADLVQAFCRRPLLRLALVGGEHGTVTFQTQSGPKTVAFERGTIRAASSSSITVVAKDGTTWTWDLISTTKLRSAGQQVTSAKLSTGEVVLVAGTLVNGTYDARLIRIHPTTGS